MFTDIRKAFTVHAVFVIFTIIGSLVEVRVNCLGSLQVKLISYTNPGGKGNNGHCCDGRSIFCESGGGCDHYFKICIDAFNSGDDSIAKCPLGSKTTGTTYDQASNSFGSRIGSTENPMSFNFTAWQSGVRIKVEVWDDDSGGDDKVDYVKTNPALSLTPARFDRDASWTRTTLRGRTSLVMDVRASCGVNWFGIDCSVFCVESRGPNAFYTCDSVTGRKVCEDGWTGVNCDQNVDDCVPSPCQNQGQCVDGLRSYTCSCQQGYTGLRCETNVDECIEVDCNNGICIDGINSHVCLCNHGFIGDACEERDHCLDAPCQNNGTCVNNRDGFNCSCERGWTGQRCEEDIDECISELCGDHSTGCENTAGSFACVCQTGWHGHFCETDVDECQSDPCSNNGTCVDESDDYHCLCSDDWLPEFDCRVWRPPSCAEQGDFCQNNGTCVDDDSPRLIAPNQAVAVRCRCLPGWTGDTCEEAQTEESEMKCSSSFRSPCLNGGTCLESTSDDAGFICRCSGGFLGSICERSNDNGSHNSNNVEADEDENGISWLFEGQLSVDDIMKLRTFIVNITTKRLDPENSSELDENSQEDNLANESYEIVYNVQTCNNGGKKSSAFLFKLKMNDILIEKSVAEKMLHDISSDSFKFLSLGAKFLMSARLECVSASELALKSEEGEQHRSWPVVVGVTCFILVVLSLVAAVLFFKRKRLQKPEFSIDNPIYEGQESDRGDTKQVIDRESQQMRANLFLIPNPSSDQTLSPSDNHGF